MYDFNYHRPASLEDARAVLQANAEARIVAGGMTLLPTMKLRLAQPSDLIDLAAVAGLAGIEDTGAALEIGAMTTHAEVASSAVVESAIPALAALAESIGDAQVRNRGTIGGSLANNDPAADYPAAVLGLGATIRTDRREISADEFFVDVFETAMESDEILTAVLFPKPARAAYAKFPNPASRYAVVGVMVAETDSGVRVAVTGAGPSVFRATAIEEALARKLAADSITDGMIAADGLNSDIHASAEYRAHLVGVMARRAVAALTG